MKPILIVLIMLSLSGCAAIQERIAQAEARKPGSSFVGQEISHSDAKELAQDMAAFLEKQLPAAKTILEIQASGKDFYPLFREQLTRRGFGVIEVKPGMEKRGIFLRYRITQFYQGILVRMEYDGKAPSRYYDRGQDGHLTLQSSYTLREASK
jgi:uncharacterized protein YceK